MVNIKRDLCEIKEANPSLNNIELARKYNIGKVMVTDILREKNVGSLLQQSKRKFTDLNGQNLNKCLVFGWITCLMPNKTLLLLAIFWKRKQTILRPNCQLIIFMHWKGWLAGFKYYLELYQFRKQGFWAIKKWMNLFADTP